MKKMQGEWDEMGKRLLGKFYMTSQESEKIQRKLDSGELVNMCANDRGHELPSDVVEKYSIPMKW